MTQPEALQEARKRWGDDAEAYIDITGLYYVQACPLSVNRYGSGDSWEAAIADADRRASTDVGEKCKFGPYEGLD